MDEQDDAKVVAAVVELLKGDAANRRRRRAEWECNRLWLRGVRGARVRRTSEDRNAVELVVPLGAFDLPPVMDRTDELLEKYVAHLTSDPAIPDAEPATDSDADRDSAEFTTRLLTVEGSESGYNNQATVRKALRKAGVYGSGFVYPSIDPQGGGWRPMEIKALPTATTPQDATTDPATGAPVTADHPALKTRYVTEQGQIVDDPTQAKAQWIPKIDVEVLTGEQVVLLPYSCAGASDALGCIIIRWTPLEKLRGVFPEKMGNLTDEATLQKLVEWRPEDAKFARPGFLTAKEVSQGQTDQGKVRESALICTLSLYYRSHGAYQKGAYVCVAGGDMVLHKRPWSGVVQIPNATREECLDVPLAQFRQFDDDIDDDPFGYGLVKKLGPADEVRGDIVLGWQEYLDKFLHPHPLIPMGSNIQPDAWQSRDDVVLYYNPAGKPEVEQVEPFPADAKEFYDRATQSQDSATGLEEAAQGGEAPTVKSGIHAQIVVQQSHVNMSQSRANAADGQERLWRLIAQLIRVFYTVPMKLKYQGEDGSYKEREWSRADLGSTKDIRIAKGSFTQQAPEQKQANLDARFAQGLTDAEEYERLSASNLRASMGFQDNPHRMRVRRQITKWRDRDPQAFADVRPADYEQDVARIRWLELRRAQVGSDFDKNPQGQQALLQEYQLMRQAAGITTIAEQQQAAAQQQQQQAQAEQQKQGAQLASKERQSAQQIDAQQQESDAQRQFDADMQGQQQQMDLEREAMRSQGAPVPA